MMELHDLDFRTFTEVVDACEGDVYMVTPEGDRINLKSKLCQLLGFTQVIEGGRVTKAHIQCTNPDDERRLFRFNLFGEQ